MLLMYRTQIICWVAEVSTVMFLWNRLCPAVSSCGHSPQSLSSTSPPGSSRFWGWTLNFHGFNINKSVFSSPPGTSEERVAVSAQLHFQKHKYSTFYSLRQNILFPNCSHTKYDFMNDVLSDMNLERWSWLVRFRCFRNFSHHYCLTAQSVLHFLALMVFFSSKFSVYFLIFTFFYLIFPQTFWAP